MPGEYMLIDHIAPPGMKASYFSAQSLGWLGAAFNPMLTGLILTHLPHWSLFVILIVAIVAAWLMIFRGINAAPGNRILRWPTPDASWHAAVRLLSGRCRVAVVVAGGPVHHTPSQVYIRRTLWSIRI